MKISQEFSQYYNGYKGPKQSNISPGEGVDVKESVSAPSGNDDALLTSRRWVGGTTQSTIRKQKT